MFSSPAPTSFPAFATDFQQTPSVGSTGQFQLNLCQPPSPKSFNFGTAGTSPNFNFSSSATPQQPPFTFAGGVNLTPNGPGNIVTPAFSQNGTSPAAISPFLFATAPSSTATPTTVTTRAAENGTTNVSLYFGPGSTASPGQFGGGIISNSVSNNNNRDDDGRPSLGLTSTDKIDTRKIMEPVFSGKKLIGFTIIPSKINDFLTHIANFKPSIFDTTSAGKFCTYLPPANCDKEMLELVGHLSQYCWKYGKNLAPSSHCGFFLLNDNDDVDDFGSKQRSKFKDSPFHKNYSIWEHEIYPSSRSNFDVPPSWSSANGKRQFISSSYWKSETGRTNQYIFKPKILKFLDPIKSSSRFHPVPLFLSRNYSTNDFSRSSSNLLKETFSPSIRQEYLKCLRQQQSSVVTSGSLPFRLDGLLKPHYFSDTCHKKMVSIPPPPPLNYDDYLKEYSEEKNRITDSLIYWNNSISNSDKNIGKKVEILLKPRFRIDIDDSKQGIFFEDLTKVKEQLVEQSLNRFQNNKSSSSSSVLDIGDPSSSSSCLLSSNNDISSCNSRGMESNIVVKQNNKINDDHDNNNNSDSSTTTKQINRATTNNKEFSTRNNSVNIEKNNEENVGKEDINCVAPPRSKFLSIMRPLPLQEGNRIGRTTTTTNLINLTKKYYYCDPPSHTLESIVDCSSSSGQRQKHHCLVHEFRVGHEHFGHVTFHGVTDVLGLNLDDIIDFKLKEFNLYPNENEDQSVCPGQGLKRPATVTLFHVWPMDKERTHFIVDHNNTNYERMLRRSCQQMGVTFVSYEPELGHWTFRIHESVAIAEN